MSAGQSMLFAPPAPSVMARLDPRGRMMAAMLFALVVLCLDHPAALAVAMALALLMAVLARLPLARTARRLLALEGFMVLVLLTLPFTVPGDSLIHVAGFTASTQGLARAGIIVMKANAVTLALMALTGSMAAATLGGALARLGVPERFVVLLLFTIRYVDVLNQELARLRLAMRARAFRPNTSLHTWRSMGWLVGMLLVMSVERAERIHAAMRCRGFTGRFHLLDDSRAGALDWGFAAAHVASAALLLALDVT